eukprot:CAMPEP_0197649362 /NCGR_PEP_ID=MMETSP1338-20131121/28306_1 /TAXON_ID=43686 ORGANISM="Pelagodinium beii, Strain RCC1491" /NCGR_SAMPLE_ID=MMETSP1338 /ASSEMBLY_ACC=CAM_ASM_000754 /LENGTH=69 /DNA_ID=CAMNT_0043223523 /DNA_START=326 /DNA_END=535 /DNA_ORIENTATION=+
MPCAPWALKAWSRHVRSPLSAPPWQHLFSPGSQDSPSARQGEALAIFSAEAAGVVAQMYAFFSSDVAAS